MQFSGKHNQVLREKALKEANQILTAMFVGNAKELFKHTQLSWRFIRKRIKFFNIEIKQPKKVNDLFIPIFEKWEIKQILFHSPVMIDVFALLGHLGTYRIRMIAEKKPYVTNPEAPFRYNPNSLRKVN